MNIQNIPETTFILSLFILREREREREIRKGAERERERGREKRIPSRLCADSPEPNARLEPTNREIMT